MLFRSVLVIRGVSNLPIGRCMPSGLGDVIVGVVLDVGMLIAEVCVGKLVGLVIVGLFGAVSKATTRK